MAREEIFGQTKQEKIAGTSSGRKAKRFFVPVFPTRMPAFYYMPLYKHQQEAIELFEGDIALFHDPGLGKTRTCLEIFKKCRGAIPSLRLLVVCPLSLVNAAWGTDIAKFTDYTFMSLDEGTLDWEDLPDIVIINYEKIISKKYLPTIKGLIEELDFMCVLDESSRLKNNKSITTKTLLDLSEHFRFRIIASGTPMPNSEMELWGQMSFLAKGVLHRSFYGFRNTFFHLERGSQKLFGQNLSPNVMRQLMMQGWKYGITSENRQSLMSIIKPYAHWVKKEDALDLPEKINEIREAVLDNKEKKAYNEMKKNLLVEIGETTIIAQTALTKLMKLRQATSGFFYNAERAAVETGRSKLNVLKELLEELGNKQVIIWIEFKYEAASLQKELASKYGQDQVESLYSETLDKDSVIKRFQEGGCRFLIAHPRSAAHGLTFVNCDTMIFYSLDFSFEAHEQARNRIHRIGQKNVCLYYYLLAAGTIDHEILSVLNRKKSLQEAVQSIIRDNI